MGECRMTGIGSSQQGLVFGGMSNIPEKFRDALGAGINFFEIRTRAPMFYTRHISGPFAVSVHQEFSGTRNVADVIRDWKTGEKASARFEVYEMGQEKFAAVYLPDDPWWHNRLIIIDNHYAASNAFNLLAYHTQNGVFPGQLAKKELDIFYELITIETTEHGLFNPAGRMVASFSTKAMAEEDIKDHNYKRYSIRPITVRIKSPHVQALIRRWTEGQQRSRYGWTDCTEFAEIKAETIRKMEEFNSTNPTAPMGTPVVSEEAIMQAILKLPPEKRAELRTLAEKRQGAPEPTIPPPGKEPTRGELLKEAKVLKIKNPERMKKADLLKAVIDARLKTAPPIPEPEGTPNTGGEVIR